MSELMDVPLYADLYFGMSDSRNEMNREPSAFIKSYVDLNGISAEVIRLFVLEVGRRLGGVTPGAV